MQANLNPALPWHGLRTQSHASTADHTCKVLVELSNASGNEAMATFDVRDKLCVAIAIAAHINAAIAEASRVGASPANPSEAP